MMMEGQEKTKELNIWRRTKKKKQDLTNAVGCSRARVETGGADLRMKEEEEE